jgi:hypothetical protein
MKTKLSACRRGDVTETLFVAAALVNDWEVFLPFGHAQAADVCLVRPRCRPLMVQVKTAYVSQEGQYSVKASRGAATARLPYQAGDFDALAAYLPDRNQFVFWTLEDIRGRVTVRYNLATHRAPGNWDLLDDLVGVGQQVSEVAA